MSDLTESEVIDRMKQSLAEAIDACKELAVRKLRQQTPYDRLREHLKLIEGCCRQLAAFRGDGRWLPVGIMMEQCHQRAGGWLRGYKENGQHVVIAFGEINKMFTMLGGNLMAIQYAANNLVTAKTGTVGPILPKAPDEGRRMGRPALATSRKTNLILPARMTSH